MAPSTMQCAYKYVLTPAGQPKILPVDEYACKDEESPAEYNTGGYCPVKLNDTFKLGRYRVLRKLGWGHFSTVWLVKDTELNRHSALKVVKSAGRYAETARDEIKLLSRVASISPLHPGRQHIVSFLDSFSHQGPEASHICIVFEPLGEHLLALIERNKRKGVPRALVKVITQQVLLGLEYLHDECDLVHTDIKPENILISIPDVEAHISNELTHSPSPTSRRVGVPPPTKSRPSVSIPQQRSRRQVQIFDSQPLSSPGSRSGGVLGSISGSNSVSGSYVSPVQMSHMAKYGVGLSTSAPKVPSGLSASSPRTVVPSSKSNPVTAASSQANSPTSPPSTSSSTSSFSSSTSNPFTIAGSVGTPPTSLSNSFGSAMAAIVHASEEGEKKASTAPVPIPNQPQERVGLPMKGKKQAVIEETALSTSWKDKLGLSRDMPISVSHKSTNSISGKSKIFHGHTRSSSGISVSGSWKDPGLSAPAPALVVSAVVSADGDQQGDYFHLAGTSSSLAESGSATTTSSESSTATITKARPSPGGTPLASAKKSSGFKADTVAAATEPEPSTSLIEPKLVIPSNPNPSLLSQTAPPRVVSSSSTKHVPASPHVLSAPVIPPSPPSKSHTTDEHNNTRTVPLPMSPSSAASLTPTAASPPPPTSPVPSPTPAIALPPPLHPQPHPHVQTPALAVPKLRPSCAPEISIKIADLGNATPSKKHYTEDIQTRQYRSPEAIIGRKDWGTRADIWSVACLVFELLTAEFLFDPQGQGDLFSKDDDHMAQIIELLGDFALDVKQGGKYSADLFDANGALRYIKTLKPWPLKRVMMEKYLWNDPDATVLCAFLEPMLAIDPRKRADAKDMIGHPWLEVTAADDVVGEW
ncbi:Protein kinase dsk1 [Mycena sanguinolenta]|uniref:non-specific serine/threonine protein kinase n=1 Tax=Mycena sanguinolenta TaxID=230812 RepID=A0A8H7DAE9_9AGAR|nr:Protein kinase dsk1 [Mycena sanguinolenta]